MDVFDLRARLVADYQSYTRSFIKISDPRIDGFVDQALTSGAFWPEPLLQLNPTFLPGGTIDDLVGQAVLHPECARIFRIDKTESDLLGKPLVLHEHQRAAILKAKEGRSYVLTSGTGSGKSLTYIVPIVDHVLRHGSGRGIQAIVVYPMNALANSQYEELSKFLEKGYAAGNAPVRFARFTGQEKGDAREALRRSPPDILLTNYMMLELLLTRAEDRELVRAARGLRFLVFDEFHTHRGRQGADVALLIRRCRQAFNGQDAICIGTSATMASGGSADEQRIAVAGVAQSLFGVEFTADQVIGETLERATRPMDLRSPEAIVAIKATISANESAPSDYDAFRQHPLASWIESTFGVKEELGSKSLVRQVPRRLTGDPIEGQKSAAEELSGLTGFDAELCAAVLRRFLLQGATLRRSESSRFPIFAFRLHQFFTRGDTVWATLEQESDRHLELAKKVAKPGEPDKRLFPLVFCRHCGTAYYRVKVVQDDQGKSLIPRHVDGKSLLPREGRREHDDDGEGDAYVYLSAESPWPRGHGAVLLERLPDFLKETSPQGVERVRTDARGDVPEPFFADATGRIVSEGSGLYAALIKKNFLFCLEPSCGVGYTRSQRSERNKLATLGVDSRSTATTILAVRALLELQQDQDLKPEARKLLSFTDNRQDASLQAGHFNDFVQVALLRSALHKATQVRGPAGLSHGDLSRSVFDAMQLRFEEYAADPEVRGPARTATHDALRRVIDYYLYRDLQRGWRVTAPNLEDCGLLHFEYEGLRGKDGLLNESSLWAAGFTVKDAQGDRFIEVPPAFTDCPPEIRDESFHCRLKRH